MIPIKNHKVTMILTLLFMLIQTTFMPLVAQAESPTANHTVYLPVINSSAATTPNDQPPQIIDFHVEPATINAGETVTLSWNVGNASKVSIEELVRYDGPGERTPVYYVAEDVQIGDRFHER